MDVITTVIVCLCVLLLGYFLGKKHYSPAPNVVAFNVSENFNDLVRKGGVLDQVWVLCFGDVPRGNRRSRLETIMFLYLGAIHPRSVPAVMCDRLSAASERFQININKQYTSAIRLTKTSYLADLTGVLAVVEALAVGPTLNHLVKLLNALKTVGYQSLERSIADNHYDFNVIVEVEGVYHYLLFRLFYSQNHETHEVDLMLANFNHEEKKVNCSQICCGFNVRRDQLVRFMRSLYEHFFEMRDPERLPVEYPNITPDQYHHFCREMDFYDWRDRDHITVEQAIPLIEGMIKRSG